MVPPEPREPYSGPTRLMPQARRHAGQIVYFHPDGPKGRERFGIDVRADGSRTIRSYCEMGEGELTRDASWTLGADHRPVEGHVRVVQEGKLKGSAWYHLRDNETQCESITARFGRSSQVLDGRCDYLGLHPLVGDGMIALAAGIDRPGVRQVVPSVTCSYDINGETSLVALPIEIVVTYEGPEEIEVPAGRFSAQRYALQWQPHWPPAMLWVHGEDAVFLRLEWEFSGLDSQLVRYGDVWDC